MKVVDIVREYLVSHGMGGLCEHVSSDYDPECSCVCLIDGLMGHCAESCADCVPTRIIFDTVAPGHGSMNVQEIVKRYMLEHEDMELISFDGECGCGLDGGELFICGGVWRDCVAVRKEKE